MSIWDIFNPSADSEEILAREKMQNCYSKYDRFVSLFEKHYAFCKASNAEAEEKISEYLAKMELLRTRLDQKMAQAMSEQNPEDYIRLYKAQEELKVIQEFYLRQIKIDLINKNSGSRDLLEKQCELEGIDYVRCRNIWLEKNV